MNADRRRVVKARSIRSLLLSFVGQPSALQTCAPKIYTLDAKAATDCVVFVEPWLGV